MQAHSNKLPHQNKNGTSTQVSKSQGIHHSTSRTQHTSAIQPRIPINSAAIHSCSPHRNTQCTQEPIFHYFTSQRQEQTGTAVIAT